MNPDRNVCLAHRYAAARPVTELTRLAQERICELPGCPRLTRHATCRILTPQAGTGDCAPVSAHVAREIIASVRSDFDADALDARVLFGLARRPTHVGLEIARSLRRRFHPDAPGPVRVDRIAVSNPRLPALLISVVSDVLRLASAD